MDGTAQNTVEVNINDKVKVKVTKRGWDFYRDEHKAMTGQLPAYTPPEDDEGWSEWTFHHLMNVFGPQLVPGQFGDNALIQPTIMVIKHQ